MVPKGRKRGCRFSVFSIFYENALDFKILLFLPFVNHIKTSILSKYGISIFSIVVETVL